MNTFNLSGTINAFRVLFNPSLSLPQAVVSHFSHLRLPLEPLLASNPDQKLDIRAIVLDKDNCFARPNSNQIDPSCSAKYAELRAAFPGNKTLIVSNSAGATRTSKGEIQATALENATETTVLRHAVKKPGCGTEIMSFFQSRPETGVTHPSQIAVIGDRLFTDVVLANTMGAHAIWVKDGVIKDDSLIPRLEKRLYAFLIARGYQAPQPRSDFE